MNQSHLDDARDTTDIHVQFLSSSAPEITVKQIGPPDTSLPEFAHLYACILDGVLSAEECGILIKMAEQQSESGWYRLEETDSIELHTSRRGERLLWESADIVAKLWARISKYVPELHRLRHWPEITRVICQNPVDLGETWEFSRLNERMRFLKYHEGDFFNAHYDSIYTTPDNSERSFFTIHLYLNGYGAKTEEDLQGGATIFSSRKTKDQLSVQARTGRVLIFQQSGLLHAGGVVLAGTKFTMKTDIMYQRG